MDKVKNESPQDRLNRLYDKFCKDGGMNEAKDKLVTAALEWHRLRQGRNDHRHYHASPLTLAKSEVALLESIEAVEGVVRRASLAASTWAQSGEEPADFEAPDRGVKS